MSGQVVELRVWGVRSAAAGLVRMARGRRALRRTPGVGFAKLLGTGSGETFRLRDADLRHWALLTVCDDEDAAARLAASPVVRGWDAAATEVLRVVMTPLAARGTWSGVTPFRPVRGRPEGPVAAVTRARLRPTRARAFWRAVPPVSADLGRTPGLLLSLGIGEAPLGLQGTFSLWRSTDDLVAFASDRAPHRAVVARTAEVGWYAEELFARFAVREVTGSHRGRRP